MSEVVASKAEIAELEKVASQVRRDILRMVNGSGNGHPGGALGCADWFVALYFKLMTHDKNFKMNGSDEDLVFLGDLQELHDTSDSSKYRFHKQMVNDLSDIAVN